MKSQYKMLISFILMLVVSAFILAPGTFGQTDNWTIYKLDEFSPLEDCLYPCITFDSNDHLWLGCTNKQLYEFDGNNWTKHSVPDEISPTSKIRNMVLDSQDNLYMTFFDNSGSIYWAPLWKYDPENFSWEKIYDERPVWTVTADDKNNIWYSSQSTNPAGSAVWYGLFQYDGASIVKYDTTNSALPSNGVWDIAIDINGNLWLATGHFGYPIYDPSGSHYPDKGGIVKYNGLHFTIYDTLNSPIPFPIITNIAVDMNNDIWAGVYQYGLLKKTNQKWTNFTTENSDLPENYIRDIKIDLTNNVWLSTFGGLVRINGDNWHVFNSENSPLPTIKANWGDGFLTIDAKNNVWIVASDALVVYHQEMPVSVDAKKQVVELFRVPDIYPNPFNASTNIDFTLLISTLLNIDVYDINGKFVAKLFNGIKPAGQNKVKWDATSVPSGTYLIKISSPDSYVVKKCVLLK